jgi:hypothetical protein
MIIFNISIYLSGDEITLLEEKETAELIQPDHARRTFLPALGAIRRTDDFSIVRC